MSNSPSDESCANCRFYKEYYEGGGYQDGERVEAWGDCRRQSPLFILEFPRSRYWPRVSSTDWCGLHVAGDVTGGVS